MDPSTLPVAATDLARALALSESDEQALLEASLTLVELRAALTRHVARLLATNPALLMSLLYRVDVPERAVKTAFAAAPEGALAEELAELILRRQLQKLATRGAYGNE